MKKLTKYTQYKNTIFNKLSFDFKSGRTILDLGCGPGDDAVIFRDHFGLKVTCVDVYKHKNIDIERLNFKRGSALDLCYKSNSFEYVFMHDVLHHIDEKNQSRELHIKALIEAKRVCKKRGYVIIVEGNRYNPLFYPHMVKRHGHEHFSQKYFMSIVNEGLGVGVEHKFFEAHHYPYLVSFFKVYEVIMDNLIPKNFRAYNTVVYQKL